MDMEKNKMIMLVGAVVAIVAIAAVAVVLLDNEEEERTYVFLLEDGAEKNWYEAKSTSAMNALKMICEREDIELNIAAKTGFITTMNEKGTVQTEGAETEDDWDDDVYMYWVLFSWNESEEKWDYASTSVKGLNSAKYIAYVYEVAPMGGAELPTKTPADYAPVTP